MSRKKEKLSQNGMPSLGAMKFPLKKKVPFMIRTQE